MAIFSELKIADFPGRCVASLSSHQIRSIKIQPGPKFISPEIYQIGSQNWYEGMPILDMGRPKRS